MLESLYPHTHLSSGSVVAAVAYIPLIEIGIPCSHPDLWIFDIFFSTAETASNKKEKSPPQHSRQTTNHYIIRIPFLLFLQTQE